VRRGVPEDLSFRSLAAPGLDEDDLVAALAGIPGEPLWGEGRPSAFTPKEGPRDPERERRRRHEALLRRWPVSGPS
jgi:hypothetical protein